MVIIHSRFACNASGPICSLINPQKRRVHTDVKRGVKWEKLRNWFNNHCSSNALIVTSSRFKALVHHLQPYPA
ncbi:hypothetical protein Lbir_0273 [Legionella birminghamensis]|uniref:Uncharacterized protein n=1 Tax=Legionella birminghamensis TaxID=28083 RepID=A0A378IBK9_9GAMM|nr:hypothetical protein Lbir_0273 [Legionella birminghamensis]STX32172.1 Uncharacterised protein [Legionella birminghamensis]